MLTSGPVFSRFRSAPRLNIPLPSFFVACLVLWGCGGGAPAYTPEELAQATAQVREAYYAQDHYFGVELGEKWALKAPEALELRAWTVANLTSIWTEGGLHRRERRMAEEMVSTHPESPWSWFALAHAMGWGSNRNNEQEVFGASEKAIAGLPDNPDPLILHAELLWSYRDRESARAFLDELPEPMSSHPDIRALRVFHLATPARDRTEAETESIIETYEEVLAEDPDHILANYGLGRLFKEMEEEKERARPYLEQAAGLSPSPMTHYRLWEYISEDPDLDSQGRQARVTEDLRHVLENFPESPGRWAEMARDLRLAGYADLQRELEERVLQEHPESWAAERVLADRISSLAFEWRNTPPNGQERSSPESLRLEEAIDAFLARPQHRDAAPVQEGYWNLFLLEKEKPAPDLDRLSELAGSWAAYRTQVRDIWADQKALIGTIKLAQYPQALQAAKDLLAVGQEEMDKFLDYRASMSERLYTTVFDSQERHVQTSQAYLSVASSLVLAQERSFEEAEATLGHALDYDPEGRDAQRVLPLADLAAGKIKELRAEVARDNGDAATAERFLASAEEFYLNGLRRAYDPFLSFGLGWTNPNEAALRGLFEKRNGDLEGFQAYLASAKEGGLEARRTEILASRIEDPQPILPFALENLTGEGVSSESYLGKVVIINFWGTW
jgi:tetratricopeptide (TPR) repeat protein